MSDGITFQAVFASVKSTVDGGWRVALDVSQEDAQAMLQLGVMRDAVFQVALVPTEGDADGVS